MKRLIATMACFAVASAAGVVQAGPNLLVNGGFEATPAMVYYDGSDPNLADDVPGWLMYLGAADGSWVQVAPEADPAANGWDADMAPGPAGGGLMTAPASRPAVVALLPYHATVTYDNYFSPTSPEFFIEWFDALGGLIGSDGGTLGDPSGPFGYDPYNQQFEITATAPLLAASAGVRFDGGNPGYSGLAADHFHFGVIPEPSSLLLTALATIGLLGTTARQRR
jgi:hypothetical protein